MDKNQTLRLFEIIACNYPGFEVSKEKLEIWTELLAEHDFEKVKSNVLKHIKRERFIPTISEIIDHAPKQEDSFLDKLEEMRRESASPEVAAEYKAKIREMLHG